MLKRCLAVRNTSSSAASRNHYPSWITISAAVKDALRSKKPIVSLESTIITHGMPYPQNIETAKTLHDIVKQGGAEPATIAILDGKCHAGLDDEQLYRLATAPDRVKISSRDIAPAVARRQTGGTTIAGTMVIASKLGIRVLGTGGLGGVHRHGESTMDISADLDILGRIGMAVVTSGPKSILDIRRTMEYLETKGVTVTTIGPDNVHIPAFYARSSGIKSPLNSPTVSDAARIVRASENLSIGSAVIVFNPISEQYAIPTAEIDQEIHLALKKADSEGISGTDVTPYLLAELGRATAGRSLEANMALVEENVRVATEIAVLLSQNAPLKPERDSSTTIKPSQPVSPIEKLVVIGSVAIDSTCTANEPLPVDEQGQLIPTSLPGRISENIGGVGYNIACAAAKQIPTRFITAVGSDTRGAQIRTALSAASSNLNVSYIQSTTTHPTASYTCVNNEKGDLIVGVADMDIINDLEPSSFKIYLKQITPDWLILDANTSKETMKAILESAKQLGIRVIYEPTSVDKCTRIFGDKVPIYPDIHVHVVSPNMYELDALYSRASDKKYFETTSWWDVTNSFYIDSRFRDSLDLFCKSGERQFILDNGIVQKAIHLLPFFPTLIIKMGSAGCLVARLVSKSISLRSNRLKSMVVSQGRDVDVVIQFFPAPTFPNSVSVINVNGAGDALIGTLASLLASNNIDFMHAADISHMINASQKAASERLVCINC